LSEHKPKKWNLDPAPPEDQASAPAAAPELVDPPASGDELSKLLAEKQELMNTLVRRQADFENYRKRVERERHADRHRGVESLIEHILPVLDAFDRALAGSDDPAYANYRKGFELIRKQLWESLSKQGLVRVESVGQEFNPHMHHAIERVETTEYADGTVIGEMQPGYIFHEKVLRPAMVRVAGAPEPHSASASKRDN
jgi:molecular chaperone GrpE